MESLKKFLNSKTFTYLTIAILCLLLACISDNYDYDLYARLIVGHGIIEKSTFYYKDFLSYTPTHNWYDHEWGSGVIFYVMLKHLGPLGLVLIQAFTMFLTVFFIIKTQQLQKHAYPTSLGFISIFLILFAHQNPSIVRCHMFSFMFFAMFLYFLEKTRIKNSNIIWWIPFIVIIWNNLHGGVVSGLGLICLYILGEYISKQPIKKYLLVLIISTPLLIINPYGTEYLTFLLSANMKSRIYITEWWDVFAKKHIEYYYPIFCTTVFGIAITTLNKKIPLTKLLTLLISAYLGITHVKLLSLPLIVIAALYSEYIIRLTNKYFIKLFEKTCYILIWLSILYIPITEPALAKIHTQKFPTLETEFIRINQIRGNILTSFELGSYISYKLYPQNLIYMDGRYEEVYFDDEFYKLIDFQYTNDYWQRVLNDYPTEILILKNNTLIYNKIINEPMWERVYDGPSCGVFLKANRKTNRKNFRNPTDNFEYYQNREFITYNFSERRYND